MLAFQQPPTEVSCGSMKVIAFESSSATGRATSSPILDFDGKSGWRLSLVTLMAREPDRIHVGMLKLDGADLEFDQNQVAQDPKWRPGMSEDAMEKLLHAQPAPTAIAR